MASRHHPRWLCSSVDSLVTVVFWVALPVVQRMGEKDCIVLFSIDRCMCSSSCNSWLTGTMNKNWLSVAQMASHLEQADLLFNGSKLRRIDDVMQAPAMPKTQTKHKGAGLW